MVCSNLHEHRSPVRQIGVKPCTRIEDRPLACPAVIDRRYRNLNRLEACLPDRPEARLPCAQSVQSLCVQEAQGRGKPCSAYVEEKILSRRTHTRN